MADLCEMTFKIDASEVEGRIHEMVRDNLNEILVGAEKDVCEAVFGAYSDFSKNLYRAITLEIIRVVSPLDAPPDVSHLPPEERALAALKYQHTKQKEFDAASDPETAAILRPSDEAAYLDALQKNNPELAQRLSEIRRRVEIGESLFDMPTPPHLLPRGEQVNGYTTVLGPHEAAHYKDGDKFYGPGSFPNKSRGGAPLVAFEGFGKGFEMPAPGWQQSNNIHHDGGLMLEKSDPEISAYGFKIDDADLARDVPAFHRIVSQDVSDSLQAKLQGVLREAVRSVIPQQATGE